MNQAEVKDKIRKLLRLAGSPNEHEAAAAAAKAQELCDLHNLAASQIGQGPDQPDPDPDLDLDLDLDLESLEISPSKGKREGWEEYLFADLGQVCDCAIWISSVKRNARGQGQAYMAVGYPADVALLQYLYPFLHQTILRLYRQGLERQKARAPWWNTRQTYHYKRGFTLGATQRIIQRLTEIRDARRAQDDDTRALVVVKGQQVQQWVERNLKLKPSASRHRASASPAGFAHGRAAANSINLERPLDHQAPERRRLD